MECVLLEAKWYAMVKRVGMLPGRTAIERRPPRRPVKAEDLADLFLAIVEGAFVLSKTMGEPELIVKQIRQYRNYLELLFDAA